MGISFQRWAQHGILPDKSTDLKHHPRVEKAVAAAGVRVAPWLRHMVRQITMTDFPGSWQEAPSEQRSHDSHTYGRRFMLRLDDPSQTKLQQLIKRFGASKAEIIRQLLAQAEPEDFPPSCHTRAAERRARQTQPDGPTKDRERLQ